MLEIKKGDALRSGADIICHQTNCCGIMGAGIAKQIHQENPIMFEKYRSLCYQHSSRLLGRALILLTDVTRDKSLKEMQLIANCFGQAGYGRGQRQTVYKALAKSFVIVKSFALENSKRKIAIPYFIGCGLAGGDWGIVSDILEEVFTADCGLDVILWKWG